MANSGIVVFVQYKQEEKNQVIADIEAIKVKVLEVSDILNMIVCKISPVKASLINKINGVTSVTDKHGKKLE